MCPLTGCWVENKKYRLHELLILTQAVFITVYRQSLIIEMRGEVVSSGLHSATLNCCVTKCIIISLDCWIDPLNSVFPSR